MCTVTVVPIGGGGAGPADPSPRFRMVCNRDELRTRPPAAPPCVVQAGTHRAMMPIDGEAGGTWVAANDAGLAATVLNLNLPDRPPQQRARSRGAIIPMLMSCDDAEQAATVARDLVAGDYEPFRLVIVDEPAVFLARSDGERLTVDRVGSPGAGPLLFTSSGLGDHHVEAPRRALFDEMFAAPPATWLDGQQRFHRHRWPDRLPVSVRMSRDDAKTVSITELEIGHGHTAMRYWADPEPYPAPAAAEAVTLGKGA